MMATAARLALGGVVGITYVGAFSRFTHGRHTPAFYQYQIDRAPDDASTRIIPFMDVVLATLLVVPTTRTLAALAGTLFQCAGIVARVASRKDPLADFVLCSATAFVAWASSRGII